MNDNYMIDTDIDETLHNGDVSSENGLLNFHTFPKPKMNNMNMIVYNGYLNVIIVI